MRRVIRLIALTCVAAGMALPFGAAAQASTQAAGTSQATPAPVVTVPTAKKPAVSPSQRLDNAKKLLDEMPSSRHPADVRDLMARLRSAFDDMASAYATGASVAGDSKDKGTSTAVDWQTKFFDIERDLADLIGGSTVLAASATGTAGTADAATSATDSARTTASTSATSSSPTAPATAQATPGADLSTETGLHDLDFALRAKLERFRLEVELFFDSTTMDLH
jgi:hypothetical protein